MTTPPAPASDATAVAPRLHWAWIVAVVAFVTLVGAAAFRSVPGVLIEPLHEEFGWSHGLIGSAVSLNLMLFGLISPFAAALMDRFGVRPVVTFALVMVAAGSGLTVFMTKPWQLIVCWGLVVGIGTGSMSMAFVATITSRWFVARRGLVSGILTAGNATGQLIFLPVVAWFATNHGWRTAAVLAARPRWPSSRSCCSSSATTRPTWGCRRSARRRPTPVRRRTSRSARVPAAHWECCATPHGRAPSGCLREASRSAG